MKKKKILLLMLSFGIFYSLISLMNHYLFRTYSLDLGLYTQALYKYSHFELADSTQFKTFYEPLLGGHFDLYLILFSPLVYLFGTYTLLVIQIISVLFGGLGVYKYFYSTGQYSNRIAFWAAFYFYISFGIIAPFSFDYHSVVVASSLLPWFFLFLKQQNFLRFGIVFILLLISQEDFSIFLLFILIGLLIEYRKNKTTSIILTSCIVISIAYFFVIIHVFIPHFSHSNSYTGFLYSTLGNTPIEAIQNLLLHPLDNLGKLFTNHTGNPAADYVKLESFIFLFLSGLYLLLFRLTYFIMLIPLFIQKMFHDNFVIWGIDAQYTVQFVPILAIGTFTVINTIKKGRLQTIILIVHIILTTGVTIRLMDNTVLFTDKSRIRVYKKVHYTKDYDVNKVYVELNKIPSTAKISATSVFIPHLSLREHIYQFPMIKDAEFIILSEKESTYPIPVEEFNLKVSELKHSKVWELIYENDGLIIFKKKSNYFNI